MNKAPPDRNTDNRRCGRTRTLFVNSLITSIRAIWRVCFLWTNNLRIYVYVLLSVKTNRFGTLGCICYIVIIKVLHFTTSSVDPKNFGNIALALLSRAQPVIPLNLYSLMLMNIIAWGPQVTLAKHFAECSMLPHVQSCDCVIK